MPQSEFVLVDISNSFTKVAFSGRNRIGRVLRLPTADLTPAALRKVLGSRRARHAVAASVVPDKNAVLEAVLPAPICWVGHQTPLGIGVRYPKPQTIGADRLANAVAARTLHGTPAIVVDFGTAVTFDVIARNGDYIGGVIAPGLGVMSEYLHRRTALLPLVELTQPPGAVGKSTQQAMLSGAVFGYRGLVKEILLQIRREQFPRARVHVVATGGDAKLIGAGVPLFDAIAPQLTLEGLRLIGNRNFPDPPRKSRNRGEAHITRNAFRVPLHGAP